MSAFLIPSPLLASLSSFFGTPKNSRHWRPFQRDLKAHECLWIVSFSFAFWGRTAFRHCRLLAVSRGTRLFVRLAPLFCNCSPTTKEEAYVFSKQTLMLFGPFFCEFRFGCLNVLFRTDTAHPNNLQKTTSASQFFVCRLPIRRQSKRARTAQITSEEKNPFRNRSKRRANPTQIDRRVDPLLFPFLFSRQKTNKQIKKTHTA